YTAYRLVPTTRYETRSETVKIPVTKVDVVPEKITQNVPVTQTHMAQEKVVTRVAIGPSAAHPGMAANVAQGGAGAPTTMPVSTGGGAANDGMGGMAKLETDPPKQSIDWRQSDGTARH
ncbi:MAG TPA: hypothetical protein VMF30_16280, partial [Pirellulales bacterium]|nr:hypothetical protein [Pirellulales bacterium]